MKDKKKFGTDGFTVEQVKSLVGSSKKMQKLYKQGSFDTEMEVFLWCGTASGFVSQFVGCDCPSPGIIINFFKYILEEMLKRHNDYEKYMEVEVCQIFCREDKIIAYCDAETIITVDENFNIVSDYINLSNKKEYVEKLKGVINWVNSISPVPVYGIEYWCRTSIHEVEDFGKDKEGWMMGYCEALLENNYLTVDEDLGDIPGEYVLGFIEKEYINN